MNFVAVIACLCVLSGTSLAVVTSVKPSGCSDGKCLNGTEPKGDSVQPIVVKETVIATDLPVSSSVPPGYLSEKLNGSLQESSSSPLVEAVFVDENSSAGNDSDETTTSPSTTIVPATTKPPTTTTPSSTTPLPTTVVPVTTVAPVTPNSTATTTTTSSPTSFSPPVTKAPSTTKSPPTAQPDPDRRFDGPSFIGGIVFALGVTAIGFVAWKFYKARTERNYHTL